MLGDNPRGFDPEKIPGNPPSSGPRDAEEVERIAGIIVKRAQRARMYGSVFLSILMIIILGLGLIFLNAGTISISETRTNANADTSLTDQLQKQAAIVRDLTPEQLAKLPALPQIFVPIPPKITTETTNFTLDGGLIYYLLQIGLTRVLSIVMAVFLIQISIQFARYYFRIADYMDARADAVRLSRGNVAELKGLVEVLSPSAVEFGKMPSPMPSKIIDVLQEAVKKIPSR